MTKQAMCATLTVVSLATSILSSTAFAQTPAAGDPSTVVVAPTPAKLGAADNPNIDSGIPAADGDDPAGRLAHVQQL